MIGSEATKVQGHAHSNKNFTIKRSNFHELYTKLSNLILNKILDTFYISTDSSSLKKCQKMKKKLVLLLTLLFYWNIKTNVSRPLLNFLLYKSNI